MGHFDCSRDAFPNAATNSSLLATNRLGVWPQILVDCLEHWWEPEPSAKAQHRSWNVLEQWKVGKQGGLKSPEVLQVLVKWSGVHFNGGEMAILGYKGQLDVCRLVASVEVAVLPRGHMLWTVDAATAEETVLGGCGTWTGNGAR